MRVTLVRLLVSVVCLTGGAVEAQAQTARDLANTPLEDLMRIEITSAARREQVVEDAAAAVFVLTQDDIRRSGIRSLPELFRLVPGMQVAQINSNKWAVGIRGFNELLSNKMLVLVDGRSIYKRTFSGVFWHAEDLMLEDIDRIEVIRGPGGATWGANAVNGIVNIITKSAADTNGGLIRVGAGSYDHSEGAARYGGRIGSVDYRVFGLWADHGDGELDGEDAGDDWRTAKTGFRADWKRGRQTLMLQGSILDGSQTALWKHHSGVPGTAIFVDRSGSTATSGDALGRWTFDLRPEVTLQVQSFYSRQHLVDPVEAEHETVGDVEAELHVHRGRQQLLLGGGHRMAHHVDDGGGFAFTLVDVTPRNHITNLFVQDELTFRKRLRVTAGVKVERDSTAGWNWQPTARALWETADDRQHVWGAISRTARTPSLTDLNLRLNYTFLAPPQGLPVIVGVVGNPDYETEDFVNFETGYRYLMSHVLTLEVSSFFGDYDKQLTIEPQAPFFEATPAPAHVFVSSQYQNLLEVKARGVEVTARLMPLPAWRIDASYSGYALSPRPSTLSRDARAATFDGNAPTHQWQIRSSVALGRRGEVSASLFRVGELRQLQVPAYTRVDARGEIGLSGPLSLVFAGQNLTDRAHLEFVSGPIQATQVRRNLHVGLTWRFQR